jgi:DNA repair ATPase RecN
MQAKDAFNKKYDKLKAALDPIQKEYDDQAKIVADLKKNKGDSGELNQALSKLSEIEKRLDKAQGPVDELVGNVSKTKANLVEVKNRFEAIRGNSDKYAYHLDNMPKDDAQAVASGEPGKDGKSPSGAQPSAKKKKGIIIVAPVEDQPAQAQGSGGQKTSDDGR